MSQWISHPRPQPLPLAGPLNRGRNRATHSSMERTLYLLSAMWGTTPQSLSGIVGSLNCCSDLCKREQGLTVWALMDGMLNWSMTPSSHALARCRPKQCCNWFCRLTISEQINVTKTGGGGIIYFPLWYSCQSVVFSWLHNVSFCSCWLKREPVPQSITSYHVWKSQCCPLSLPGHFLFWDKAQTKVQLNC